MTKYDQLASWCNISFPFAYSNIHDMRCHSWLWIGNETTGGVPTWILIYSSTLMIRFCHFPDCLSLSLQ